MQKISPFLWFNDNAEEAVNHCVSIFPNSRDSRLWSARSQERSGSKQCDASPEARGSECHSRPVRNRISTMIKRMPPIPEGPHP